MPLHTNYRFARLRALFSTATCGCALVVAGFFSSAVSAITLPELQQQLATQSLVRGDFELVRTMEMFSAPLQSAGHFLLAEQQGLHWQQTSPFPVSLVLTKNKLSQQFGDNAPQVVAADDNPMVFYFSHVFLSLFKGDTGQLNEQFDIALANTEENRWQLVLTPKSAPLNAVFQTIRLSGNEFIEQLTLTEIRGDVTDITFTNQRTAPVELTIEEQRAFQL
ncbi:outer membrane lipoprotein carrier protein LolA [Photobacterium sp. SDRW27]|uniref:LolA family protein n=1 Tax=Photobacterium obscurum TaxID=2829490 RepID=UPI0022436F8A|nr:outer membrane lipoprotein carrier protein LolA [Photobacterium obscurum]MCW8328972.1 outer membrane lipoprotein carrier protein LolA [Photobacterium obscurum]